MLSISTALISFVIVWLIIFVSSLLYLNRFEILLKIIRFNFEDFNKLELWLSLVVSFLIAAVITYSLF